jgi:hypothetical protein
MVDVVQGRWAIPITALLGLILPKYLHNLRGGGRSTWVSAPDGNYRRGKDAAEKWLVSELWLNLPSCQ